MVTFIQARNHGGTQSAVNRIVIHATVTPTHDFADNVAADFHTTSREASAHYVVDQAHVFQCLHESTVGWHAPPNTGSIGIELCDPQAGPAARWADADHEAMLRLAAKLVREVAGRWHVPLVKLTAADLKAGKRGICGHADVSAAWHLTDHIDPGSGFPWAHFMDLVKGEDTDDMDPNTTVQVGETWDKEFEPTHYPAGYLWVEAVARGRRIERQLDALTEAVAALAAKVESQP